MYALIDLSNQMLEVNNQLYTGLALIFSPGTATSQQGERLEAVVKRADFLMYEAKQAYYARAAEQALCCRPGRPERAGKGVHSHVWLYGFPSPPMAPPSPAGNDTSVALLSRHGRPRAGYPDATKRRSARIELLGTRPGMTTANKRTLTSQSRRFRPLSARSGPHRRFPCP
jgi:hypothetical protein